MIVYLVINVSSFVLKRTRLAAKKILSHSTQQKMGTHTKYIRSISKHTSPLVAYGIVITMFGFFLGLSMIVINASISDPSDSRAPRIVTSIESAMGMNLVSVMKTTTTIKNRLTSE